MTLRKSKVLLVGDGGCEHALAWKLSQSPNISTLYVTPGNDGMLGSPGVKLVQLNSLAEIVDFVVREDIALTIIAIETWLIDGLGDALIDAGCMVWAPSAVGARLEGSKHFAKQFMDRHNIPTANYQVCETRNEALKIIEFSSYPLVVKVDGVTTGLGVTVCDTQEQAKQAIHRIFDDNEFGYGANKILIEKFVSGYEVSVFVFTDGTNYKTCPLAQDYKRLDEGDSGPNSGGMGCYAPVPQVTPAVVSAIDQKIIGPTIRGLREDGIDYQGVLFIGLMVNDEGPRVLEYNCRWGDPEGQVLMLLLDTDLLEIAFACLQKRLGQLSINWRDQYAACVVLTTSGYPGRNQVGDRISGLKSVTECNEFFQIFYAGVCKKDNYYSTHGGKVLGVTAMSDTLEEALETTYKEVNKINWDGMHFRRDIGHHGLHYLKHSVA